MINDHLRESSSLEAILQENLATLIDFHKASYDHIRQANSRAQKMLQMQVFSQSMMETLINDLLDLAKMEADHFKFDEAYFNPLKSIRNAFECLLTTANHSRVRLIGEIEHKASLCKIQSILGDERRFSQILLNFVSNSLKFTDSGSVTVGLKIKSDQVLQDDNARRSLKKQILSQLQNNWSVEQIDQNFRQQSQLADN